MPLESVSLADLRDALADTPDRNGAIRLMAAIIYKNGPSVPTIAAWLDRRPGTIYRWFERMEDEPLQTAVLDRSRPGRPRKLDEHERAAFDAAIARDPAESGFSAPKWTPQLAQTYIERKYGASYSLRHVRRLLEEAGSSRA